MHHATGSTPLIATASCAHWSIKALQRPGNIKQDQGRLQLCQKYVAPGAVEGTAEKTITSCILSQTPSRARIRRSLPAGVAGHGTDWNSRDEILQDKRKEAFLCIHTRNNLFWISGIFIVLADLREPIFFKGSDHRIVFKGSDFCFSSFDSQSQSWGFDFVFLALMLGEYTVTQQ